MNSDSRAAQLAAEIEKHSAFRKYGRVGVALAAVALAAFDGGGPASLLVDKAGSWLLKPDLEKKMVELCGVVAKLEPGLDRLEKVEDAVARLRADAESNRELRAAIDRLASALENHGRSFGIRLTEQARGAVVSHQNIDMEADGPVTAIHVSGPGAIIGNTIRIRGRPPRGTQ